MMTDIDLTTGACPLARWSGERPGAVAVIENNVPYSYATLARNVVQAAKLLAAAGLGPGMIAGIECDVRYLHLVLILACEVLGAAHVAMVESDLTSDSELMAHCHLLCIQIGRDRMPTHPRVIQLSPGFVGDMVRIRVDDRDLNWLRRAFPAGDLARIGRTSGTTGRQKFLGYGRRSLRNIVDSIPYLLKFDRARENFVSLSPFSQMGTYSDSLLALRSGHTIIYGTGDSLSDDIRMLPACHTSLLVRDAANFAAMERSRSGRVDSCSIRLIGGFVSTPLLSALRDNVTSEAFGVYSTNETNFITVNDDHGRGTLLPDVSVRIVDDDGHDRKPGESGVILLRTSRMADGYIWDAAQTARQFADGWFRPNDIGVMPEPGELIVLGRADDMINLGGIKLAPHAIEAQIKTIDRVSEAILIGVDNVMGIGELHVFVERNDPAADDVTEAQIASLLVGSAGPCFVHYVNDLPRTETGKVRRDQLHRFIVGEA